MGKETAIQWCDSTWNPIRGCTKISQGCKNCYAETFAERFRGVPGHPFEQGFDLRLVPHKLGEPVKWKEPRRVFVNSMSDLFHDGIPFDYICQVFAVMGIEGRHTYQILTKRADRLPRWSAWAQNYVDGANMACRLALQDRIGIGGMRGEDSVTAAESRAWPLPNVHLGVSVESAKFKDRIDHLRKTPAAVRFLSIEPLLEDVGTLDLTGIHQVIVGAESGHHARPMREDWVRSIRDQAIAQGVKMFYKQRLEGGRKVSLPMLDGRQWAEMP